MANPVLITKLPRNGTARDGRPGRPARDGRSGRQKPRMALTHRVRILKTISNLRGKNVMKTETLGKLELELTIDIEELEQKVAPDGGETVLPLPIPKKGKR
jgi:hypothetical protein